MGVLYKNYYIFCIINKNETLRTHCNVLLPGLSIYKHSNWALTQFTQGYFLKPGSAHPPIHPWSVKKKKRSPTRLPLFQCPFLTANCNSWKRSVVSFMMISVILGFALSDVWDIITLSNYQGTLEDCQTNEMSDKTWFRTIDSEKCDVGQLSRTLDVFLLENSKS